MLIKSPTGLIDNHKFAGAVQVFDLDVLLAGGSQVRQSNCDINFFSFQ
jgi:hypothetical protein